ncbi:fasciclin domain-containing protein [Niabella ginsengisoli]|uniref:Fasciclin domain-containing protein n=1 Tax=Niabella ginsengisoli TaxID=522298 RepID=A0ABS9SFZ9_9BACT|nr:fasciclin domain-containing protein [Niabella ginsengisoli]MCH5597285.1 fasciclin domain-containing protein [Niabella ginsengisoli]
MKSKVFTIKLIRAMMLPLIAVLMLQACNKDESPFVDYDNNAAHYNGDALSYLRSSPGVYDSMLLVINRLPGVADSLQNGSYTIFATSNRSYAIALQNINNARRDSVPSLPPVSFSTMDQNILDSFFSKYIIKGLVTTEDLTARADGLPFPSMKYGYNMHMQYEVTNASGFLGGGPKAILFSDPRGSVFTINWIRVYTNTVDIKTNNAIVHVLDVGHNFGFGNDFINALNRRSEETE